MTATPTRAYGGISAATRVEQRRGALIEAALELVHTEGWRQLTVEAACRRAGLNKRYFYESFADIEALAEAVIDQLVGEVLAVVLPDSLDVPREELIITMVGDLADYAAAHPSRAAVFFGDVSSLEAAARRQSAAIRGLIEIVARDGRAIHGIDDPIADVAATVLVQGSIRALLDWLHGHLAIDRQRLVDHVAAIWLITTEGVAAHARTANR